MILIGAIVNAVCIFAGGFLGLLLKKGMPERVNDSVMKGLGLCVVYIGISGALKGENTIVLILSMAAGSILGSLINIDALMQKGGKYIETKLASDKSDGRFAEGFISFSLLVCVGAMAIVGSMESGLSNNHSTLFAKSLIDGVAAVVMASAMGPGVIMAGVCVFVYEAFLTLAAGLLSGALNDTIINEMTCAGSLLIIAIGLNMLKITNIKIANYIPVVFFPILFCLFC